MNRRNFVRSIIWKLRSCHLFHSLHTPPLLHLFLSVNGIDYGPNSFSPVYYCVVLSWVLLLRDWDNRLVTMVASATFPKPARS